MVDDEPNQAADSSTELLEALVRRLDRINANLPTTQDQLLELANAVGRTGLGIGLGMIVDGVLIYGALGSSEAFTEVLTDAAADAVAALSMSDEHKETILGGFAETETSVKELRDEARDRADEVFADDDVEFDDVPWKDVHVVMRALRERTVLDLRNVQIHYGSHDPIDVDHIRVHAQSVSAWWPLKAQGIEVNYTSD